ncbi:NusA-like transcription termination signal-binding factor [Candidatus Woesearchaeota archaeon]|nr:NusA-like transcription termination signal-binding factor [Candidatus Woesearchaeota archaeon]
MKYNLELIQYINHFEKITNTQVKDCFFEEEKLIFIVNPGQASKAVGKNGVNAKKFVSQTNKRIKITEFNEDPIKFINSLISPIKAEEITLENKLVKIKVNATKDKGLLIGRNSKNLENLKKVVQKYFQDIEDIKII